MFVKSRQRDNYVANGALAVAAHLPLFASGSSIRSTSLISATTLGQFADAGRRPKKVGDRLGRYQARATVARAM